MGQTSSSLRDRMIFLVGARRSGTYWLQRILGSHPDVFCVPSETTLFTIGLQPLSAMFHHSAMSSPSPGSVYMDRRAMLDAMRNFCDAVFLGVVPEGSAAKRILERTPDHVRSLHLIGGVFPDAHVVHIIRDGRDVARSLVSQPWGPATVREAAEEWRSAVEAGRRDAHHVGRLLEVRYEELLADPVAWVPKVYEWLGLSTSSDIVASALVEAGIHYNVDARATDVAAGKWRSSFSRSDLEDFMEVAGSLLAELGYGGSSAVAPVRAGRRREDHERLKRRPKIQRFRTKLFGSERSFVEQARSRVHEGLRTTERFLALAQDGAIEINEILDEHAYVRVVTTTDDREARGADALTLLRETLASDPAFRGRQVRGDLHPSVPAFTFVGTYEADGTRYDRVFVISTKEGRVDRCIYYACGGRVPSA